jgi:hypothetical protein
MPDSSSILHLTPAFRRTIALYLCFLMINFAHVLEEIYGNFRVIAIVGPLWFAIINWLIICIPVVALYYILLNKRWAYIVAIIYAAILVVNGLVHSIGYLITRQYYGGAAGCCTGLAYLVVGPMLIISLRRLLKTNR